MVLHERLEQLISANRGIVRTAEAVAAGISKPVFYRFIKDRNFEKVAHGVYAAPDAWIDPMYLLGLRSRQAVFSHETALFLHDLTDREPTQYSVTVKTGYNPSKLKADGIKVYTVKRSSMRSASRKRKRRLEIQFLHMIRSVLSVILSGADVELRSKPSRTP